jgi:hypothetical protein
MILSSQQTSSIGNENSFRPIDGSRNVIRLRACESGFWEEPRLRRRATTGESSIPGIERYEYSQTIDDDYRHRMLVNLLAVAVLVVLIAAGVWVMDALLKTTQEQHNCFGHSGNCAAVSMPNY